MQSPENAALLDGFLEGLENPTGTSRDLDAALIALLFKLEFKLDDGKTVKGYDAMNRLPSAVFKSLQEPHVPQAEDPYRNLSADEVLEAERRADAKLGIEQPVPPLLAAARQRLLATFYSEHELAPADIDRLTAFLNESKLSVNMQNLAFALKTLVENGTITPSDSPSTKYNGTTYQTNTPRRISPTNPNLTKVEIAERVKKYTPQIIARMTADEYAEASKSPEFRAAIDALK